MRGVSQWMALLSGRNASSPHHACTCRQTYRQSSLKEPCCSFIEHYTYLHSEASSPSSRCHRICSYVSSCPNGHFGNSRVTSFRCMSIVVVYLQCTEPSLGASLSDCISTAAHRAGRTRTVPSRLSPDYSPRSYWLLTMSALSFAKTGKKAVCIGRNYAAHVKGIA